MRRYTSGGIPSIPRPSGRLTPCAPGPLPYSKSVAVSGAQMFGDATSKMNRRYFAGHTIWSIKDRRCGKVDRGTL